MALLDDDDRSYLEQRFAQELEKEVAIQFFTRGSYHQKGEEGSAEPLRELTEEDDVTPQACQIGLEIYQELVALSPLLKLETYDLETEAGQQAAQAAGIDGSMLPVGLYQAESLPGKSRFFGLPTGYEFGTLVENLIDLSRGQTNLSADTRASLAGLDKPAHITVFVTPTCGYCPSAVRMAHQMAMTSPFVSADIVEANEFQELASRYYVYGVPRTIVNERVQFDGAVPEAVFLGNVLKAVSN